MPFLCDSKNERAIQTQSVLERYLAPSDLDPNLYVVIGGDGFMLQAVRTVTSPDAVFLGLNCGRLGFLLNNLPYLDERIVDQVRLSSLRVMTFPRIHMKAVTGNGMVVVDQALNDIYLERMTGQTCHLNLKINGTEVVREMVCDGLILCTALGSTAYSYSAGGSVLHPSLEVVGITPICPHLPKLTPMVFPLDSRIEAQVLDVEKRRVRAVVDGVDYDHVLSVTVSDARSPIRLAFFNDHNFTGTLVGKVLKG